MGPCRTRRRRRYFPTIPGRRVGDTALTELAAVRLPRVNAISRSTPDGPSVWENVSQESLSEKKEPLEALVEKTFLMF